LANPTDPRGGQGARRRIRLQQGDGDLAAEITDVSGQLRKSEIDQAVQLAHAVAEVLDEPIAKAHELAQLPSHRVRQTGGRGPPLGREPRQPEGVDRVGLRAPQVLPGKPPGPERDGIAGGREHGEEVLPVVSGRFHHGEHLARRTEHALQVRVAAAILPNAGRLHEHRPRRIHDRNHVSLGSDADSGKSHPPSPSRRIGSGASEPMPALELVDARPSATPQDTVRALDIGRGRHSQSRGLLPHSQPTATLSRNPSTPSYRTRR
jgi:hypothetical protein